MQIFDTFAQILVVLQETLSLLYVVVVIMMLQLVYLGAISRNVKQRIVKPYRPNIFRRTYHRIRRRKRLPTPDKKELTEK